MSGCTRTLLLVYYAWCIATVFGAEPYRACSNGKISPSACIYVEAPRVLLVDIDFEVTVELPPYNHGAIWPKTLHYLVQDSVSGVLGNGSFVTMENGDANLRHQISCFSVDNSGFSTLTVNIFALHRSDGVTSVGDLSVAVHSMPGIIALLPPLVTMFLAVWVQQVFIALLTGCWVGSTLVFNFNPLSGVAHLFDAYVAAALSVASGHSQVVVFCFLLGGLIGVVQKSGGAEGLALLVTRYTHTPMRASLWAFAMNLCIFFDDYSGILVVGSTFSSIVRAVNVAPAKLAFIVHGVSACFVSLVPLSSWVGVQIGYIAGQSALAGQDPFVWYIATLPYRLFPLLWLLFILIIVLTERDFGPMLRAERIAAAGVRRVSMPPAPLAAHTAADAHDSAFPPPPSCSSAPPQMPTGPLAPRHSTPTDRWYNAALPFAMVALTTLVGMYLDGRAKLASDAAVAADNGATEPSSDSEPASMVAVFAAADAFTALMRGALFGCVTAVALVVGQGIMDVGTAMKAWVTGIAENILSPVIILLLAWSLGQVISDISAAKYLAASLGPHLSPPLLPALVSLLCFAMSLGTGTAFGSLGIMIPLVVPLAAAMADAPQAPDDLLLQSLGAILGGCLFGNVVSPIADDTILASLATSITVPEHVSTMFPYALLVAGTSVLFGYLPMGMGWLDPAAALLLCAVFLLVVVLLVGERVPRGARGRLLTDGPSVQAAVVATHMPVTPQITAPPSAQQRRRGATPPTTADGFTIKSTTPHPPTPGESTPLLFGKTLEEV